MDRDQRWERTDRALRAILQGVGEPAEVPVASVAASYERGVTDEFLEPIVARGRPRLDPAKDTAIFFNFRPDRARQLSQRLLEAGVDLTTMTRYRDDFPFPVAFDEQEVRNTLAEVLAGAGARQLHAAETE
jgi:2,3-bisphosphoglycerate-independent phosphoglycerate mutase